MKASLVPTRALIAAILGLLAMGMSHAEPPAKAKSPKAVAAKASAPSAEVAAGVRNANKPLEEAKGASVSPGQDRQFPAPNPRPPVPPRMPGDLQEKLGNKAVGH